MATIHAIYLADDGLGCMRAIVRIVTLIVLFLFGMLALARSVWPDDISVHRELNKAKFSAFEHQREGEIRRLYVH